MPRGVGFQPWLGLAAAPMVALSGGGCHVWLSFQI